LEKTRFISAVFYRASNPVLSLATSSNAETQQQ